MSRHPSLRWRITLGLIAFQIVTFFILSSVAVGMYFNASSSGVIVSGEAVRAVTASLTREDGGLSLAPNAALRQVHDGSPGLWYIVQAEGERLSFGAPPPFAVELMNEVPRIKTLDIRGIDAAPALTARFERISSPVGPVAIILGGGGFISDIAAVMVLGGIAVLIPTIILSLLTLLVVPPFIRRNLRGVLGLSARMEKIDFDTRGTQLPLDGLPREIMPVVGGMNAALRRIDNGAELTERFFMNAAHELRTPIAILQLRLDALPEGDERDKLHQITRRLSSLARQLLEIERFRQGNAERAPVDLGAVLSGAVADLAPYALSEGYDLSLDAPDNPVVVQGDAGSLDRMVVNLIQNAVQHGGGAGAIIVRLDPTGVIEVQDEGPGIPEAFRARVFEPFFRRNPHGAGAGLGLKMVRDIARAHGGEVEINGAFSGGTMFRIRLPIDAGANAHQTDGP